MDTSNTLSHKKCVPCEGGVEPLTQKEIELYLPMVKEWQLEEGKIRRTLTFTDFSKALNFVNRVGDIAEQEGHHPDINLHDWNKVTLTLYTHAIGGLHLNDFVLASKINELS